MQSLTGKRGLRLSQGRLQEAEIPYPILAAIPLDLIGVDVDDLCKRQEQRIGHRRLTPPTLSGSWRAGG